MSTQPGSRPRVSFGPFEYDPNSGELRKHRSVLRLQGQPLRILSILIEQPGELVGRLELQRQLWPGVASGDFDHGLNAAVNKLRQTLNDSADQPRYIETLPGQGYRFIAPLQTTPTRSNLEVMPSPPSQAVHVSRVPFYVAAGVAALALAVWVGWKLQVPVAMQPMQFTISPPAGFFLEAAGPRQSFALSPDGNAIVFSAMDKSGHFQLFIRQFHQLESQAIPESRDARAVFWSPDGSSVYFTSFGKMRRLKPGSPASVVIADSLAMLTTGLPFSGNRLLVANNQRSAFVLPSGTRLQPIERHYAWPTALPDEKYFLAYRHDPKSIHRVGLMVSFDGKSPEIPLGEFTSRIAYTQSLTSPSSGYLVSVNSGTLVAQPFDLSARKTTAEPIALTKRVPAFVATGAADFSVSRAGVIAYQNHLERTQFYWVDREGKALSAATAGGLSGKFAALSPDGKHIAIEEYDVMAGLTHIRIIDTATGTGRRIAAPMANRHGPVWSPDSKSVVYMRSIGQPPKLGICPIDESGKEILLPEAPFMTPTSWSKDGRYILYNSSGTPLTDEDGQGDIFMVDLKAGDRPELRPFIQTSFHEANAHFSPDMSMVAFMSTESGRSELFLQALSTTPTLHPVGERKLISKSGAISLRWRPDGKELYFLSGGNQVFAAKIPSAGPPVPLFTIPPEARSAVHGNLAFDVSPDGKRFLVPIVPSTESPSIVVIRNWEAALNIFKSKQ